MRRLMVFNHVSLDGYFTDLQGKMDVFSDGPPDMEWDAFVGNNASGSGTMLFGRVTYDMMSSFWPTHAAILQMPLVADRMNSAHKVVFSHKLDKASWNNTELERDLLVTVRRMKAEKGDGMVIFGSGSIVAQLSQAELIDEYQLILNPVVLGGGRSMFDGLQRILPLKLVWTRPFKNGKVLLTYQLMDGDGHRAGFPVEKR